MESLPTSVEEYLREAGFSPTELLILKRLIEENGLTLRQLAAKTGKSTGVLDQAMKKLLRRNIVTKDAVNAGVRYRILSLHAIVRWVQEDTKAKQEMLRRRHQNFESFIASLSLSATGPQMQCFEGHAGMEQAYMKLLGSGREMLHYFPVVCAVEDDPLREFRVQYFRERRSRGIFARFIVHDTPLGRRFATRDPFEYRKTILVAEDTYPISFEKVIVGDTVACFNHAEKKVCFLQYPELAETERRLFERLWQERQNLVHVGPAPESPAPTSQIPYSTRTLSALREFLLSRNSIALFCAFALAAAGMTYGLYRHNHVLHLQRVREQAIAIAVPGAMSMDVRDVEQIRTPADASKVAYASLMRKMNEIRAKNPDVKYVYILRPMRDGEAFTLVADADADDPFVNDATASQGSMRATREGVVAGKSFDLARAPVLSGGAYKRPIASPAAYSDAWGTWLSGFGPISDGSGEVVAVLGVDVDASQVHTFTMRDFAFVFYFLGFFLLFAIIRLAAFNTTLLRELWQVFQLRKALVIIGVCLEVAYFITLGMYFYNRQLALNQLRQKLLAIVSTAASNFEADDIESIHWARDMRSGAYQKMFTKLNEIRDNNREVKWMYIMRPTNRVGLFQFVVDADTNINLPEWTDANHNGIRDLGESSVPPGTYNDGSADTGYGGIDALQKPITDEAYFDQWGYVISASAPIFDSKGKTVAILGADMDISDLNELVKENFSIVGCFVFVFILIIGTAILFWKQYSSPGIKFPTLKSGPVSRVSG